MNNIQQVSLGRFFAGDHKAWTMTFFDKNNLPLILNSRRVIFSMKQDLDDNDTNAIIRKVYDFPNSNSNIYEYVLELNTNETNDLFGVFEFDVRVSFQGNASEIQFTALRGKMTIDQSVTNSMVI